MRQVLARVGDLDLVLKGGSALAFAHGLNRHSTDLDFDGYRPVELRGRIRRAGRATDVMFGRVRRDKWRFRQLFRATYQDPFSDRTALLRVDIHFRHAPRRRDIEFVDGIRTYRVEALYDQKLAALKSRIEPRDIFDLAFVMKSYGTRLTNSQIQQANEYLGQWRKQQRRYADAFERDEVLRDLTTVEETLAEFRTATAEQCSLRGMPVQYQYQRVPVPIGMREMALAYLSRQEGES